MIAYKEWRRLISGQNFRHAILWFGILTCAVAIWGFFPELSDAFKRAGIFMMVGWLGALCLIWLASVAAWRCIIHAFFNRSLAWRDAIRQSGLLLVGKYVPSGVFGLLARASEVGEGESGKRHLAAGVYEQLSSLVVITGTGLVFLCGALLHPAWLVLLVAVPGLSLGAVYFAVYSAKHLLPRRVTNPASNLLDLRPPRKWLFAGLCLTQLSVLGWMSVVVWTSVSLFSQTIEAGIGLAGAFGLSVVAGMMVVFAPGGIGIRESAFAAIAANWLSIPEAVALAALLRILSVILDSCAGVAAFFFAQPLRSQ